MDDLLGTARGPVIASHVGCDAVFGHERNLTDEHLRAIAKRGGVVGLVLYAKFLGDGRPGFGDAMKHLRHMLEVCGADAVGIGSDMDGGFGKDELPVGFHTAADLPRNQSLKVAWARPTLHPSITSSLSAAGHAIVSAGRSRVAAVSR